MRTLRDKTDEHKGKGNKNNIKTGRGTKHKRLINMENKQRVTGLLEGLWEGRWAKWGRGIKESTPEIIVSLYANLDVNFKKLKLKKKSIARFYQ